MPYRTYGCSICGRQAPRALREHGSFEKRMYWLRGHYKKEHPERFRRWGKH